jgi:Ca2+-binding EF-hand superfamily protein
MFIIRYGETAPDGYRHMSEEEMAEDFLALDNNNNYMISKNEWMINFIKMLEKDLPALEEEGPDAIMGKIEELSKEFDKIDTDGNSEIDFLEYQEFLEKNIFISK